MKANEGKWRTHKPNSNEIKLFSELVREMRVKPASQLLRSSEEDPSGKSAMFDIGKRRVGGPRQNWSVRLASISRKIGFLILRLNMFVRCAKPINFRASQIRQF